MKIKHNPRGEEAYLKMFNKIIKAHVRLYSHLFNFLNEHNDEVIGHVLSSYFKIPRGLTIHTSFLDYKNFNADLFKEDYEIHYLDEIKEIRKLKKNHRIEAWIKYQIACEAIHMSDKFHKFNKFNEFKLDNLKSLSKNKDDYTAVFNELSDELEPFIQIYHDLYISYVTKHELTRDEGLVELTLGNKKVPLIAANFYLFQMIHFIDLFDSNPDLYREINEYSWVNKSMGKIYADLTILEEELRTKMTVSKEEHDKRIKDAAETEFFMKVDDNLSWYKINDYSCTYEAYIAGGHCGTDSSADYLFSLRSFDSKLQVYTSHVTVSVKQINYTSNGIEKFKYQVHQVKGRANQEPSTRYWNAIMKLFLHKDFGWQIEADYRPETDFKPYWYKRLGNKGEEIYKSFLEVKPHWNDVSKACAHYGIFKDELMEKIKEITPNASISYDEQESGFRLEWESFSVMIEDIKNWNDDLENIYNYLQDGIIDDSLYNEIYYDYFLDIIRKYYPYTYADIVKDSNDSIPFEYDIENYKNKINGVTLSELLRQINNDAYINGNYHEFQLSMSSHLMKQQLENGDADGEYGYFYKSDSPYVNSIFMKFGNLVEYVNVYEEIAIPYPEPFSFRFYRGYDDTFDFNTAENELKEYLSPYENKLKKQNKKGP